MIYPSEPQARADDLELPVSVVRQVPQMHKLLVDGLGVHLHKRGHNNPLSCGTAGSPRTVGVALRTTRKQHPHTQRPPVCILSALSVFCISRTCYTSQCRITKVT